MATTTANGMAASERSPSLGRGYWLAATVIVLALLPLLGGETGIISNYGFLQLSLMIVYAIAVLTTPHPSHRLQRPNFLGPWRLFRGRGLCGRGID
jgi:hypothetical protein